MAGKIPVRSGNDLFFTYINILTYFSKNNKKNVHFNNELPDTGCFGI